MSYFIYKYDAVYSYACGYSAVARSSDRSQENVLRSHVQYYIYQEDITADIGVISDEPNLLCIEAREII
jgi:hypothetical protein